MVAGARVRALAEKWGVGRLVGPAAIRALLEQKAAAGGGESPAGALTFTSEIVYLVHDTAERKVHDGTAKDGTATGRRLYAQNQYGKQEGMGDNNIGSRCSEGHGTAEYRA